MCILVQLTVSAPSLLVHLNTTCWCTVSGRSLSNIQLSDSPFPNRDVLQELVFLHKLTNSCVSLLFHYSRTLRASIKHHLPVILHPPTVKTITVLTSHHMLSVGACEENILPAGGLWSEVDQCEAPDMRKSLKSSAPDICRRLHAPAQIWAPHVISHMSASMSAATGRVQEAGSCRFDSDFSVEGILNLIGGQRPLKCICRTDI